MNTIEIFHILYLIFLFFGILLLVIAIFEFFAFNIKKIFQDLTGITRKREIRHMTENTEYTGQLRQHSHRKKQSISNASSKVDRTTGKLYVANKKAVITPPETKQSNEIKYSSDIIQGNQEEQYGEMETERLDEEPLTGVLDNNVQETVVLNNDQAGEEYTSVLNQNTQIKGKDIHFLLERQILMTHTDEMIES